VQRHRAPRRVHRGHQQRRRARRLEAVEGQVQPLAVDALALTRMIEVCISPVSDLWNEAIERSAPAAIEPGGSSGWKAKSAPQASSMISGMSCAWQGERELVVVDRIDVDRLGAAEDQA
jgi:hypothetical protein